MFLIILGIVVFVFLALSLRELLIHIKSGKREIQHDIEKEEENIEILNDYLTLLNKRKQRKITERKINKEEKKIEDIC